MSASDARLLRRATLGCALAGLVAGLGAGLARFMTLSVQAGWPELAELFGLADLLRRIIAYLASGGVILALTVSVVFIGAWVLSHLRQPKNKEEGGNVRVLPYLALWSSYVPVALTAFAAVASFVPGTTPLILKTFALAVLVAAISWLLGVVSLFIGGDKQDLRRARRSLLVAGTPWYALAIYLATLL